MKKAKNKHYRTAVAYLTLGFVLGWAFGTFVATPIVQKGLGIFVEEYKLLTDAVLLFVRALCALAGGLLSVIIRDMLRRSYKYEKTNPLGDIWSLLTAWMFIFIIQIIICLGFAFIIDEVYVMIMAILFLLFLSHFYSNIESNIYYFFMREPRS